MLATSLTAAVLGVEAHLVRVEADSRARLPPLHHGGAPRLRGEGERGPDPGRAAQLRHPLQVGPAHHRQPGPRQPAQVRLVLRPRDRGRAAGRRRRGSRSPASAASCSWASWPSTAPSGPVAGVLPMLLLARRHGLAAAVVPAANHREAALAPGLPVYPVATPARGARRSWRAEALPRARRRRPAPTARPRPPTPTSPTCAARRSPGARSRSPPRGATTSCWSAPRARARRCSRGGCPGILPPLAADEALETAAIHSAAGLPAEEAVARRPFRSPHHTASDVALVGGGQRPRPGEVSLAHNGVLFLDELPEFRRATPRGAAPAARGGPRHGRPAPGRLPDARPLPARGAP